MAEKWNIWHGCHKKSEGLQTCLNGLVVTEEAEVIPLYKDLISDLSNIKLK